MAKLSFIEKELQSNVGSDSLKFRVFDRKTKTILAEECFLSCDGKRVMTASGKILPAADLTIQPCVGAKDKHGNLIYQGDVLRTDEGGWIGVVVGFSGFGFAIEDQEGGWSSRPEWEECEILGNLSEKRGIDALERKKKRSHGALL